MTSLVIIKEEGPVYGKIYQIKMTLKGIRPPIWRRFQVPGNFTFYDLHRVIQRLMEWTDEHLHEFEVRQTRIGEPEPDHPFFTADQVKDESRLTLERVISAERTNFLYTYDFGDDWVHGLFVEKIIPSEQKMEYPVCLEGGRSGPPEDIGGVWGYEEGLELLKTPPPENPEDEDEETRDMREWLEDFVPEDFDLEEINQRLKHIKATDIDSTIEALPDSEEAGRQTIIKGKKSAVMSLALAAVGKI